MESNKTDDTLNMQPNERVKFIREKLLKMSRAEIFNKYDLSVDTLAAWENGKLKLSENGIQKCISIFGSENILVSREWILTGKGLEPSFSLNLNKYFKTNQPTETDTFDDHLFLIQEIEYFRTLSPNSVTCLIANNDMLPLYSKGEYVGGRLRFGSDVESCIGKDCIVNTVDDATYVRRIVKNTKNKKYNLLCLNPSWEGSPEPVIFSVDIKSAAPIIWHRRLDD